MSSSISEPSSATGINRVNRDGQKVWIDSIEGFDPSQFASSVHGVQARMCEAVGEAMTYEQLISYGGLAFRVSVHQAMCPSAAHPCTGYRCIENSNRALPWKTQFFDSFPGAPEKSDRQAFEREVCEAIKQSIDRGIPVHYGSEEDGLIIGCSEDGRRWWCLHPYHKRGREAFWHNEASGFAGGKWPWGIGIWTEPKSPAERVPHSELVLAALKQATEMWTAGTRDAYFVGDSAYAHWLKWLSDVEAGQVADPKSGMQGNGWCFDTLIQYRSAASRWLAQIADSFEADAAAHLHRAADHYAQLAGICLRDLDNPWHLAPGPDRYDDWTSAMRREQIARLQQARTHDRAAIDAIKLALHLIEE